MSIEKRLEKLEGMYKPQRQIRPSFLLLDENGEPLNEYYAEVLRVTLEARARGEDAPLAVFQLPAGSYDRGVK